MASKESPKPKTPVSAPWGAYHYETQKDGSIKLVTREEAIKFAQELRNAARVMNESARAAKQESSLHQRSFVYGAIVLSYASLEAALNEVILWHALAPKSPLDEAERRVIYAIGTEQLQPRERSNTLQRFNLILRILGKQELEKGKAPYQAADLVRTLRNLLVHPVPEKVVTYKADPLYDYSTQQDIVRKLKTILKLGRQATFPKDIITTKCASWAVQSCEAFLQEFIARSGISSGLSSASLKAKK